MQIPKTTHKRVKYRNGQSGLLITTERNTTALHVMTMREESGCFIYHSDDGKYCGLKQEHNLDIVEVES